MWKTRSNDIICSALVDELNVNSWGLTYMIVTQNHLVMDAATGGDIGHILFSIHLMKPDTFQQSGRHPTP